MLNALFLRSGVCVSLLVAAITAGATTADPAADKSATVPFVYRKLGGATRPVINVQLNGHPYQMMVHSNASFYMQLVHRVAKEVGVGDLQHRGTYGIQEPGKLSPLGLDGGRLNLLTMGKANAVNVPVSVFETPEPKNGVGMLGIKWIAANRVVLDYPGKRVLVSPEAMQTSTLRASLLTKGYVAVPMQFDKEQERYTVRAALGSVERSMTVSTVGEVDIDPEFASQAGVEKSEESKLMSGPKGAQNYAYLTKHPVVVRIGDWSSKPTQDAWIEDQYAYMSQPRPTGEALGGMLGADFLVNAGAVIDFGNKTLYLRN
ncbi:hypothetical protein [Xanthomonas albilineans]|uniref:hypothetical protein n=1 Tax=Xanthomonas albilineans TaxID=29447 RepID=UPI0005F3463E|nr:hypothetical protein [Xanthomonas albilineans]PPU93863.1 hypothetical protein XalbCFBP2523_05360 [Xanthomonas albilineans]